VFLVDKTPRGIAGELEGALAALKNAPAAETTRCVLGLRDVLDDPAQVELEWRRAANEEAIAAHYDAVWVYGDPAIFDPVREYGFSPATAAKVRYTGYFDHRVRLGLTPPEPEDPLAALGLPPGPLLLCMVGGGQDGETLANAFMQAPLPAHAHAVLVTGPCMPAATRRRLQSAAAGSPRRRILEFLPEPGWLLSQAQRVVIMGGYNTLTEALSFEKRALVVPRVAPRQEQWIRAQRLRELGLIDVLHPAEVSPAAIGQWLARDLPPPPAVHEQFDFRGLTRLPQLFQQLTSSAQICV
jgi:predicted glycosyltransferase